MKKLLLSITVSMVGIAGANAQCTPVDCSASLPAYGGVCDTVLAIGTVNQVYSDFESFVLNDQCFDAGLIDPGQAGTSIKITNVDGITFGSMPNGMTGSTNQAAYTPTSGNLPGCASFDGTPTEIGVFNATIDMIADVQLCGFFPIDINDNAAQYVMWLTINPDPTYTGLGSSYCLTDGAVTMTPTGTTGGFFTGPGVSGSTFDPATAGVGNHTVKYYVSRMEGAAIAPAADSMEVVVTVTDCSAGISESSLTEVVAYPNPTEDYLTIDGLNEGTIESIIIMNMKGQVMETRKEVSGTSLTFDTRNLENGLYFVQINDSSSSKMIRFMKK